tara:strand:- start:1556 stop:3316 length:1761 start_codon:yes stop_codon:yes gene_type:complete
MPTKFTTRIIYLFFYLSFQGQYGQEDVPNSLDFLNNSSYENIFDSYLEVFNDTTKSKIYLKAYLKKAVKENDIQNKSKALTYLSYYEKLDSIKLQLLDSALNVLGSETTNPNAYILPYSYKGGFYQYKGEYLQALTNYLKALEFSEKANNIHYEYNTKHNIAVLKISVGKYEEAIKLFKECLIQDEKLEVTESHGHNETLYFISESYLKNKQIDSASIYIEEGLNNTKDIYLDIYNQFVILKGIQLYFQGEVESAKKSLERAIFHLDKYNPETRRSLVMGYFYLGKINSLSNNSEKAVSNFIELDALLQNNKLLFPEIREGYQYLISHFKESGLKKDQLKYLNKLLAFDSILLNDKSSLSSRISNEFDTPMLLKEKELLIGELLDDKRTLYYFLQISIFLIIVFSLGLIYQFKKRRSYKSKFLALIEVQDTTRPKVDIEDTRKNLNKESNELDIAPQIIAKILEELDLFETEKKFLNKDITSSKLARILNTNTKYLSQIINHFKQKSFSNYIKDLRIDYAIEQLKENSQLRRYTIEGIAQEMGFNSTESFSTAFRKRTGIKPSYFIKEFNNLQANNLGSKFMNLDS